ncbi:acyl-CoA dehydrogenase family protein [Nocardia bovistercoris]|uniref:Acyl-CoA/acyl-ACP dehydrogenase n=1 Tax=Nocardia bovistercoris TaxID=2785916 RepID=A0A931N135_9NOCA|nr:acyl-CoA dehydrogenase family protein [Nocardia bovistercoris]MBH0775282.1 acyl-CoA/acyl-ACP dehydrogenase [Nocardia bovistercoris]
MADGLAHTLRRNDYALDADQRAVSEAFADFFEAVSPSAVVRAAESGFDRSLWHKASEMGALTMAVPGSRGGDDATVIDLVLVAEQHGARLAPIPLVESVVAARLVAETVQAGPDDPLPSIIDGARIATIALRPAHRAARQIVPAGAVADLVLALDGDELILVPAPGEVHREPNIGGFPLAWLDLRESPDRRVLARGAEVVTAYHRAVRLWKLLSGAALVGSGREAVRLAVEFANSRKAFGQFIGTFQAISHALVDAATLVESSRNLNRKAAWFAEYEPDAAPELFPAAYVSCVRAAVEATKVGIHVQGGFGFTTESDMTLHFRHAKGRPLVAGPLADDVRAAGAVLPVARAL